MMVIDLCECVVCKLIVLFYFVCIEGIGNCWKIYIFVLYCFEGFYFIWIVFYITFVIFFDMHLAE